MNYIVFVIIYAILDRVQVNLIGTLSVSDIFTLLFFVYILISGKIVSEFQYTKELKTVSKLYLLLLIVELICEILVANSFDNIAKSVALTSLSYAKLIFMFFFFRRHPDTIKWYLIGTVLALFLFEDTYEEETLKDLLSGEQYSFFKFGIAPVLFNALVAFTLFKFRLVRNAHIVFVSLGMFTIILGARSTGLMMMMTGFIVFFINTSTKKITKKKLIKWAFIFGVIAYPLYTMYVDAVLSGEIISGNSRAQLSKLENPYNPIYALLSGRTESPASIAAIMDSPWIGWGTWAEDPGWKYHIIQATFQGEDLNWGKTYVNIIPAHSVLLQTGVNNGIFAMFIMGAILWFFIKRGSLACYKNSIYLYLIVYCIMQLLWNGLFSPLVHFRAQFPFFFFCCLYAYEKKIKIKAK